MRLIPNCIESNMSSSRDDESNAASTRPAKRMRAGSRDTEHADEIFLGDEISSRIGIHSPKIRSTDEMALIKADLNENGFCVVGNILDTAEIEAFETSFWEAVSSRVPQLHRNDRSTWTPDNTVWRGAYGAGQFKYYGMGQERHCWMIRKNDKIRRVFEEAVYGEECCVSLDGAAALFAPSESKLELHVDLVPGLPGFEHGSMQGAYNIYEVAIDEASRKAGAGFVCVPGSHKLYDEIWQERLRLPTYKQPKKHFYPLEKSSPLQQQPVLVVSPANSLVIWDSKLLHRNYGGDFTVEELDRVCRLTQFVTWHPKRYRTEIALEKKIAAVLAGKSGNHWASLGMAEPIKPFPPWGQHPVKTIIPFKDFTQASLPDDIISRL